MYLGLNEPECFSSFVGQKRIIENIRISVEASKLRNEPLDHILLYGDEGLGKTTLAKTIAKEMGVDYKILNPQIQSASMLVAELSSMKNKDILLFEDIHKLKPDIIDILVSVMKNNSCTITIGRSITAKKITLELSPIISIDNIEKDEFFSSLLNASKNSHLALSDTNGIKEYYIFAKSHTAKHRSTGFRDHGIYSALLLKYIWSSFREYLEELCKGKVAETYYSECFNEIFILNEQLESFSSIVDIAAQAVSLHNINKSIWAVKDTSSHNLDLQSFHIALKDENEAMPLAFMLRLCDELQVWDRPRFRAPSIYDENIKSDDISIVVSDDGIFLRFFQDEEQFVHPDSYSKHSFAFLRRDELDENKISCIYASAYLKKNTDSLKNAVENDLFSSVPNVDRILGIKDS